MLAKLKGKRGFTLVELMIVVAIIGVLAALAIYGVRKYIANAKSAEARMTLGRIAKDASAAYNREQTSGSVLTAGGTANIANILCASATAPVPATIPAAQKVQSSPADWRAGSQTVGWFCLRFSMQDPQYYRYNYTAANPTANNGTFEAIAEGDLNGDGTTSRFGLAGAVQGGVVNIAPNISEQNPEE
ncbi:MAG: type II secretion system protein [Polyangiaceae bacterium]